MDLDDLIKNADPARESAPPAGSSAIAHWTFAQITQVPVPRRRAYARPRFVLVGTMALGLILVLGDILIGSRPGPTSSAAAALRHAAVVVSDQSAPAPGPGQYLYTETKSLYQVTIYQKKRRSLVATASAQYLETEQSWLDDKGDGRDLLTRTPLQFSSAADRSAWDATSAGPAFASRFDLTVVDPSLQQVVPDVSGLSTDPTILERQIGGGADGTNVEIISDGPSAVFQRTARLLVGPDAGMTSSLASALYQVLADQSGARLLGATTDHDGRAGTGFSLSSPSGVSELIIEPTSGAALEVQYAPPVASLRAPSRGPTIRCQPVATCGSAARRLGPPINTTSVAPIWTDSVTAGIVNSTSATRPVGTPNA